MKIGLYPGCSLEGSSREYNDSVVAVAERLGIQLERIEDWNCCGATAAHNLDKYLALALPARILALAEKQGFSEIIVPCAACYSRLSVAKHELLEDESLRQKINEIIEMDFQGTSEIINIIQMLQKYVMPNLDGQVMIPFNHKVACYYGCLLVRPQQILKFDRPEDPQTMDEIIMKLGGTPIDWAFKVECCGAGFTVSRAEVVNKLSGNILNDASLRSAEAVIVACPMCHANLDMRQAEIERYMGKKFSMPIIYITQVVGMALGIDTKKLGLHRHLVPVVLRENGGDSIQIQKPAREVAQVKE
jgi:heterodisulfide reductase subunit B